MEKQLSSGISEEEIKMKSVRKFRLNDKEYMKSSEDREEYEKDYARLIQSPAFRRLQGKSQVFGAGTGDYYRTRLTHSLEVSQIAREVARKLNSKYSFLLKDIHPGLKLIPEVVEIAALAHDLGHPPFGHKGEEVLNHLLGNDFNDFYEGNAQNFRILMLLEKRAGSDQGLDLTAASLLAINKYPYQLGVNGQAKGLYATEWERIHYIRQMWDIPKDARTLEAQLMDLCDDIAYSTHDIEDGLRAGKIQLTEEFFLDNRLIVNIVNEINGDPAYAKAIHWKDVNMEQEVTRVLSDYYKQWVSIYNQFGKETSRSRREMKAQWVNYFASHVGIIEDKHISSWKKVTFVMGQDEDFSILRTMEILKKLAWVTMIKDFRVQRLQKRSENMLIKLWSTFANEDTGRLLLPPDWIEMYDKQQGQWSWHRLVADYISGMTDHYAEKVYIELFSGRSGSIYERD